MRGAVDARAEGTARLDLALARERPESLGRGARIVADELSVGEDVTIGEGAVVAGDSVELGDGVVVGAGSDVRAGSIRLGPNSEVAAGCRVLVAERFAVGAAARISRGADVVCRSFEAGTLLYLGDDVSVGHGGTTESTATVSIGDRVALGPRNILNANCPIRLGDRVGSGSDVTLWTHGFHFGHSVLDGFAPVFSGIELEENVWLGYHASVLPGVRIGANAIVAAGAVVTRDLPADCLAAGVPAQVKAPLARNRLAGREADAAVEGLLDDWQRELRWKGVEVERAEGPGYRLRVRDPQSAEQALVVLLPSDEPSPDGELGDAIVVSVEERPDLEAGTVFELRAGRLRGRVPLVAEDLRDHLRRRTLPCGDETRFRSIEPEAFARLRRLAG